MKIDSLIKILVEKEGGYTNNPNDRGGETKYGITKAEAIRNGFTGSMRDLSIEFAENIYKKKYWIDPEFEKVSNLSEKLAAELFDCGVNMGTSTAVKILQRVVNLFNKKGTIYPDLQVDGVIGAKTLSCIKSFLNYRKNEEVLLKCFICIRCMKYIDITEKNQEQEDFIYGWIDNRIDLK